MIRDHGMIGDGRTAALVSRSGSIDWACLPHFDSPSYFGSLLDARLGGEFRVRPRGTFRSSQAYVPDTNILETRFSGEGFEAVLRDCFSVAPERIKKRELWPDQEILRALEVTRGQVSVEILFEPRPCYGKHAARIRRHGNWGIRAEIANRAMILQASTGMSVFRAAEGKAAALWQGRAGERLVLSLVYAEDATMIVPPLGDAALSRLETTEKYWREWIGKCAYLGPYQEQVRRSALALKLLVFAPSGAIVAAPTTSLPESLQAERNWDYRYCWLRDASYTIRALTSLGYREEAQAYASWLLHSTRLTWPRLQVMYDLFGESRVAERELDWLSGYEDRGPVRVGNSAHAQHQLDVYGEVIDAIHLLAPYIEPIDRETRKLLEGIACFVANHWHEPDDGIWEMRQRRAHHTHSKLMAWVALERFDRLCGRYGWRRKLDYCAAWRSIASAIESQGYHSDLGAYTRSFGEIELDASLLVMPIVGYCPPDSVRFLSTLRKIERDLGHNGYVYRYRPRSDDLAGKEGAFGLCNFWMAEALARSGFTRESTRWIDAMVSRLGGPGLWPEEIDPDTGEFLGNFPQAFTHIGMINAALTLEEAAAKERQAA